MKKHFKNNKIGHKKFRFDFIIHSKTHIRSTSLLDMPFAAAKSLICCLWVPQFLIFPLLVVPVLDFHNFGVRPVFFCTI
jgi:hypothetical protein